ncbi:unnamed protein product [Moneuplotes crassus]|uniref:BZIP domain-containing protein n=1 Tax=Euplotes crassus TaxID=5936 RepID=A0AAD1XDR1_EUPCR|nr:unnamed protein product [Moneuplotes crassus]
MNVTKSHSPNSQSSESSQKSPKKREIKEQSKNEDQEDLLKDLQVGRRKNKERKSGKQRAKEFRERKKQYYLNLEKQNAGLQQQVKFLNQENERLVGLLRTNNIQFSESINDTNEDDCQTEGQKISPNIAKMDKLGSISTSKDNLELPSPSKRSDLKRPIQGSMNTKMVMNPAPVPPAYTKNTMTSFMTISKLMSLLGETSTNKGYALDQNARQAIPFPLMNTQNLVNPDPSNLKVGSADRPILLDEEDRKSFRIFKRTSQEPINN